MSNPDTRQTFSQKWGDINQSKKLHDEISIFVPQGQQPQTQRQFVLWHYFEYISRIARANHSHKILEVGCGRGTIALYLNKYLGCEAHLLDNSPEAIELARRNFATFAGQGQFATAPAEAIPYPDNSFDLVVSIGLAEHFPDYSKVYSEQYRVLKPGGIMISLNVPQKNSIQVLNKIYRFFVRVLNKPLKKDYYRNADMPADYKRVATKVGFKDVATFYVHSFPLFTPASMTTERRLTALYSFIYKIRGLFMDYPFKGSKLLSQAHFLIAKK